jgi:hypothetical protein
MEVQFGTYQKIHVKQKVNSKDAKKQIGCNEPPELEFVEDEVIIEIQRQRTDNINGTCCGGQKSRRQVKARNRRNLLVPEKKRNHIKAMDSVRV